MMGLRLADFAFRAVMGAIFIGWFAYVFSVQAEHRQYEQEAAAQLSSSQGTTFAEESYDPSLIQSDPYATVHDDVVTDQEFRDDIPVEGGDWGN